jgi:sporadic carbohydrate cluster 2OG-Fe(II) oxygenase
MNPTNSSFYDRFDMRTYRYNADDFPFDKWALRQINDVGFKVNSLEYLHTIVPKEKSSMLTKEIIKRTELECFVEIVNSYIKKIFQPLLDNHPVLVQRFVNLRIHMPERPLSLIPFHNGQLQGHGLGERTSWIPLTDSFDSSSLYGMNVEESRLLLKKIRKERVGYEKFQELLKDMATPANIGLGSVKAFTQENIHGSIPNRTKCTRVSFDLRVLLQGGDYGQKLPGGYFRFLK